MNDKKIISVDWLKHGDVWVCDQCQISTAKVRMLTQDEDDEFNIEYYCGYAEEDTSEWKLLDPNDKYFIPTIVDAFHRALTDTECGDGLAWFIDLRKAVGQGFQAQDVVDIIEKLYQGECVLLEKGDVIYKIKPKGKWVSEESKKPHAGIEHWYILKDVELQLI